MARLNGWLLVLLLALGACGVGTQNQPEHIDVSPSAVTEEHRPPQAGAPDVRVYFVRDTRLQAVLRETESNDVGTALSLLAAGPTSDEVVGDRLRTVLSTQPLNAQQEATNVATVTVEVSRDFTGVTGADQLLAVAQVVWTVTEFPGVRMVRLISEGRPLEVPTDSGLVSRPVNRDDYRSVAPAEVPSDPSRSPTPTPAGSSPSASPSTGRRRGSGARPSVPANVETCHEGRPPLDPTRGMTASPSPHTR